MWGITPGAAAQKILPRSRFQPTPVFDENFSCASVDYEQFNAQWATKFYPDINTKSAEYASASQLMLLLQQSYLQLLTTRLTLEQRQVAPAAAANG